MDNLELIYTGSIGWETVRLFLAVGEGSKGGSFTMCPDDNGPARIDLFGNDPERLREALTHEVFEFALTRAGLRFVPSPEMTGGHDTYRFFLRHPDLSEACARVAEFLFPAKEAMISALEKAKSDFAISENRDKG